MRSRAFAAIACLLPLAGCAVFDRPPEVRNRFASSTARSIGEAPAEPDADPDRALRYTASISTAEVPASGKGVAIKDLSDRGQAAYVEAVAARLKDDAALADAIARPDKPSASGPGRYLARGRLERRIVMSLLPADGLLAPGERLQWARLRIIPQGDARFVGWTMAANKETSINVGSVKATQTDTLGGETGLAIGKPFVDAKLTAESSRSREETGEIRDETTINARVEPKAAEIVQSAGWRDDLTGNATFDATLQIPALNTSFVHGLGKLWTERKPRKPGEISVARQTIDLPDASRAVCASLELDYVVRRLVAGQNSFTEADDQVEFVRGSHRSPPQMIAPAPRFERWGLETSLGPLHVRRTGHTPEPVALRSVEEALDLAEWLNASGPAGSRVAGADFVVLDPGARGYRRVRAGEIGELTPQVLSGGPPVNGAQEPGC